MKNNIPLSLRILLQSQKTLRSWKGNRRWALLNVVLFTLLLVFINGLILLRPQVIKFHTNRAFQSMFQARVKYKSIQFYPLVSTIFLENLEVSARPEIKNSSLLKASEVKVTLDFWNGRASEVMVRGGEIFLERSSEGKWNFSEIFYPPKKEEEEKKEPIRPPKVILEQMRIYFHGLGEKGKDLSLHVEKMELILPFKDRPWEAKGKIVDIEENFKSLSFHFKGKDIVECFLNLRKLNLNSDFKNRLPKVVSKMLDYFSPSGKADISLHLKLGLEDFKIHQIDGYLRCYNMALQVDQFPNDPVRYISGKIEFKEKDLKIERIHGYLRRSPVLITGNIRSLGEKGGKINIKAWDVRAGADDIELIPHREVKKVVGLFNPQGRADFDVTVLFQPPYPVEVDVKVKVHQASAHFTDFPYPLHNISGNLRVRSYHNYYFLPDQKYSLDFGSQGGKTGVPLLGVFRRNVPLPLVVNFTFQGFRDRGAVDIKGTVVPRRDHDDYILKRQRQRGLKNIPFNSLKGAGQAPPEPSKGKKNPEVGVDLYFHARKIAFDDTLVKSFRDLEEFQWAVKNFSPSGRVSGTVEVKKHPIYPDFYPQLRLFPQDMEATFSEFPLPISKIQSGEIFINWKKVLIKGVEGRYKEAKISIDGEIDTKKETGKLEIGIENLPLNQEVLKVLKDWKPDLAAEVEKFQPQGQIKLKIKVELAPGFKVHKIKANIFPQKLQGEFEGVKFRELVGRIVFDRGELEIGPLFGKIEKSDFQINGKIQKVGEKDSQLNINFQLHNLKLEDWVVRRLPEEGKKYWKIFQPQGVVKFVEVDLFQKGGGEMEIDKVTVQTGEIYSHLAHFPRLTSGKGSLDLRRGELHRCSFSGNWGQGKWKVSIEGNKKGHQGEFKLEGFQVKSESWKALAPLIEKLTGEKLPLEENIKIEGGLDLNGEWSLAEGRDVQWKMVGRPQKLTTSLVEVFPLPLTWKKGTFTLYGNQKVLTLSQLQGSYKDGRVRTYGKVDFKGEEPGVDLTFYLEEIPWNKEVIAACPPKIEEVLTKVEPKGKFDLSCRISRPRGLKPYFFNGLFTLRDMKMKLGLEAEGWKGTARFVGRLQGEEVKLEGMMRIKEGKLADQPFQRLQSSFSFAEKLFSLPNITGKIYGGTLRGNFSLSTLSPLPYHGKLLVQKGNVEEFFKVNIPKFVKKGKLKDGNLKSYFTFRGSARDVSSLEGSGWMYMDEAKFFDLPLFLGIVLNTLNLKFLKFGEKPVFRRAWIKFKIKNKKLLFDKKGIVFQSSSVTLVGQGSMTFDKVLDLRIDWETGPNILGLDQIFSLFQNYIFFYFEVKGKSSNPTIRVRALKLLTNPLGK